jgi:hypothetical protein
MDNFSISKKLNKIEKLLSGKSNDSWMTLKQGCEYSQCSESSLRRYVMRGMRCSRSTGRLKLKKSWIDEFLEGK